MAQKRNWQAGINTHENITFSCFGDLASTGITSALGCLGGLPLEIAPVLGKTSSVA